MASSHIKTVAHGNLEVDVVVVTGDIGEELTCATEAGKQECVKGVRSIRYRQGIGKTEEPQWMELSPAVDFDELVQQKAELEEKLKKVRSERNAALRRLRTYESIAAEVPDAVSHSA